MVEVFKTDVLEKDQAQRVLDQLHLKFRNFSANFDLDDCDKILRVESKNGKIKPTLLLMFLNESGVRAEVLENTIFNTTPKQRSSL